MKKCPFCAEQIQVEAIKCRYCGEFLDPSHSRSHSTGKGEPVYTKLPVLIFSMICLGPLAPVLLPLLWKNTKASRNVKMVVSVGIILFAVVLSAALWWALVKIGKYYNQIFSSLGNVN